MRRRTVVLIAMVICLAVAIVWGITRKATPPEAPFARVTRETIVSSISTNGKVEPIEWATARAGRAGIVQKIFLQRGQTVKEGDPLVGLDTAQMEASVAEAEARLQEARAQQAVLEAGGRSVELTEIGNNLARARLDLQTAQRDAGALERLESRQAATHKEVLDAQERVKQAQLLIQSLESRRAALVSQPDRAAAEARIQEAEAAVAIARDNLARSVVRAPIGGIVYEFDLKPGAFLQMGDLVANIGRLDRVRVKVFVDEPDLGRIGVGMPVTITWDAMPGRKWTGAVDRLPTEVAPLGTRQVGEVGCVIDNPNRDLVPGTNVNAEIQAEVVQNALVVPREALRRQNGASGVFALGPYDIVQWRPIQIGVTSTGRAQVAGGLSDSDSVALPTEKSLKPGMKVTPVYP